MNKIFKRLWYKLGIKLFGDFFKRLFTAQTAHKRQVAIQKAAVHKMQKQGLKVFDVGGIKVVAQNQKNAERKAANIRKQQPKK